MKAGFQDFFTSQGTAFTQWREIGSQGLSMMSDGFANMVSGLGRSGEGWKDHLKRMGLDLADFVEKALLKLAFLQLAQAAVGLFSGGGGGGLGSILSAGGGFFSGGGTDAGFNYGPGAPPPRLGGFGGGLGGGPGLASAGAGPGGGNLAVVQNFSITAFDAESVRALSVHPEFRSSMKDAVAGAASRNMGTRNALRRV
jgi:hypothetical protein